MELFSASLSYEMALVYLDDVIVFGRNFNVHLKQLELVFQRLAETVLKIKGSKAIFSKNVSASCGTLYPGVESMSTPKN